VGFLGTGQQPPSPKARRPGGAVSSPSGVRGGSRPPKGFSLFLALRMACPDCLVTLFFYQRNHCYKIPWVTSSAGALSTRGRKNCNDRNCRLSWKRHESCSTVIQWLENTRTMKKRSERRKHCALPVVRRSQNNFAPPQSPFPGAQDGQNLISWRWSLSSPTDPVW